MSAPDAAVFEWEERCREARAEVAQCRQDIALLQQNCAFARSQRDDALDELIVARSYLEALDSAEQWDQVKLLLGAWRAGV